MKQLQQVEKKTKFQQQPNGDCCRKNKHQKYQISVQQIENLTNMSTHSTHSICDMHSAHDKHVFKSQETRAWKQRSVKPRLPNDKTSFNFRHHANTNVTCNMVSNLQNKSSQNNAIHLQHNAKPTSRQTMTNHDAPRQRSTPNTDHQERWACIVTVQLQSMCRTTKVHNHRKLSKTHHNPFDLKSNSRDKQL